MLKTIVDKSRYSLLIFFMISPLVVNVLEKWGPRGSLKDLLAIKIKNVSEMHSRDVIINFDEVWRMRVRFRKFWGEKVTGKKEECWEPFIFVALLRPGKCLGGFYVGLNY